jgi:serine kinase of HPr protein (carbohydrate metabolism regulator)
MPEKLKHGTCVEIEGRGILLLGPSGSGKSDLALRLIDGGARLVADDQVALARNGPTETPGLVTSAPNNIRGLLEVRGLGIVAVETVPSAPLLLVVELVAPNFVERLPDAATWQCLGVEVPMIRLTPFEPSTPAKLRLAVRAPNMNDGALADDLGQNHGR